MIKRLADLARTLRHADSFLARILKSGGIITTASFWDNVLRFVRNVILAKILAPDAFGVMATIMASVSVIEALMEVGLKQSIIQHKSGAEEDYLNIVWWLSALRALAMYAVAYVAAPLIGEYVGRPEMATLLRTGFLVILFNGFVSTRFYVLEKEIRFFKSVLISQGAGLIGILASLLLAFVLRDVWALLSGYLLEGFLRFALSFCILSDENPVHGQSKPSRRRTDLFPQNLRASDSHDAVHECPGVHHRQVDLARGPGHVRACV